MDRLGFLDELQKRVLAMLENTPAADLQKNLKAHANRVSRRP